MTARRSCASCTRDLQCEACFKRDTKSWAEAQRVLNDLGIPVPQGTPHLVVEVADHCAPGTESRVRALLSLGWPARALEHARVFRETQAISEMREWVPHRSAIVLAGEKGTGKSVAAAWRALHEPTRVFWFARAATLARLGRYESDWAGMISAPALCIDDLGAEYLDRKGSFAADLDELVDTYYAARKPLVITTNLLGADILESYGARITDRLMECATWCSIRGSTMRERSERPPWE